MSRTKKQPVSNLQELRFKMAEKFAALENGEITVSEAKAFTGIASTIVNAVKVEMVNNATMGITREIDFLTDSKDKPKQLKEEFFEHEREVV